MSEAENPLRTVPLDALHRVLGARMVPFAGYAMPVQYPTGILAEHAHTREKAGLFDVSHMGQATLAGPGATAVLEALTPGDFQGLKAGRQRYTLLLNQAGGIIDDLMVAKIGPEKYFLVVNAACKDSDFAHIEAHLNGTATLTVHHDRALLALQGPKAAAVMAHLAPASTALRFMDAGPLTPCGVSSFVSRSGYTGEDGFEISVPAVKAEALARHFLELPDVAPIGLGARDSLRLEAGLPLYGSDIDAETTPVEAGLEFAISPRRRQQGGFLGAAQVLSEIGLGSPRRRVGLLLEGKIPARAHAVVQSLSGQVIGTVTSGGPGPTVGAPIALAYITTASAATGTPVQVIVRDRAIAGRVVALPFVKHRYHRG